MFVEDSAIRGNWRLALVEEVFPDDQGRVRNVKLAIKDPVDGNPDNYRRQKHHYVTRHASKLVVLLPVEEQRKGEGVVERLATVDRGGEEDGQDAAQDQDDSQPDQSSQEVSQGLDDSFGDFTGWTDDDIPDRARSDRFQELINQLNEESFSQEDMPDSQSYHACVMLAMKGFE